MHHSKVASNEQQQPNRDQWSRYQELFVLQSARSLDLFLLNTDNSQDPDDETLKASLFQYVKEKLTTAQRLARLEAEHNLVIKYVFPHLHSLSYYTYIFIGLQRCTSCHKNSTYQAVFGGCPLLILLRKQFWKKSQTIRYRDVGLGPLEPFLAIKGCLFHGKHSFGSNNHTELKCSMDLGTSFEMCCQIMHQRAFISAFLVPIEFVDLIFQHSALITNTTPMVTIN